MSRFDEFLNDDATVVGDVTTNTAGTSGETSQGNIESKLLKRLSENDIRFSINDERGIDQLNKLREKYPDAVFTYSINTDIIGDVSGDGLIEVSDIRHNTL